MNWIVATDFDGTLTKIDIGNELCKKFLPEKFSQLHQQYKDGNLSLRDFQQQMWTGFPLSEDQFISASLEHSELRPGVIEFLEFCSDQNIPVYVASCGLKHYIQATLNAKLTTKAKKCIQEIKANQAFFFGPVLKTLKAPFTIEESPLPLDKGLWCQQIVKRLPEKHMIFGIGNGSSDKSFIGKVDCLAATEDLSDYLKKINQPHTYFEDFHEVLELLRSKL